MNKFILSGNLCADPTFHAGQEESKNRCNFRIAFNHSKEKATFFNCTAWGKVADRVSKLKKGQRLLVEGDVEENEWTNSQTQQKEKDKQVNVRNAEYIDFPDQNAQPAAAQQPSQQYAQPPQGYQQPGYGAPPAPGYGAPGQPQYGQPQQQYQQQYGAPPQQPAQQPPQQQQYAAPPQQFQQPVQPPQQVAPQYNQPPQQYGAPPQQPAQGYQQQGLPGMAPGQQTPF